MKRGSSAKRLLASILGKNAPNSSSSTEVKIADEEENAETAPNMSGGSLKDIRERVSRARGKHGLSRLHSRELEVGGVCLSPKMNIPSLSDDKMERLLKEARLLALKYSKEDIVESHGGFLCKVCHLFVICSISHIVLYTHNSRTSSFDYIITRHRRVEG